MAAHTSRATIIRMEEPTDVWLSKDCYNDLWMDAGLLMLCLIVFLITRFGLVNKARSQNQDSESLHKTKSPKSKQQVHAGPSAANDSSLERLFSLLVQSDDRQRVNLLDVYRQYRTQADWALLSNDDSQRIFSNVCVAAARMGKSRVIESVFSDMDHLSIARTPELYTTLLKMYSSKRQFQDTMALWQRMRAEKVQNLDRAAWSCLLFAASELYATEEAMLFFDKLVASGEASEKDYGNMIRHHASRQDGAKALACLDSMRAHGLEPDSFTYNAVFTAFCQSGKNLAMAEQLFHTMKSVGAGVDAITYNTLLKSYAQAKRLEDAFSLVSEMESAGLSPTSVTFGTLLDACINDDNMDRAKMVFCKMQDSQCEMNTILYTTMIKGFVKMNKVDEVLHILREMRSRGVEPDSVTYSLVLKALCVSGQMESALDLFHSICSEGFHPDEIIFNNLLSGCVVCKSLTLAERLLKDMVTSNIVPSPATFSILIKLYAECNELAKAQTLLEQMEPVYGVASEPRLHWQLIHACLRARHRQSVLDVSQALIKRHGKPDSQELSKLLRSCTNFNMLDLALQLIHMAFASGAMVSSKDLQGVADSAMKKRKHCIVDSLADLASKHGVRLAK
jgi:pentatricopeptide repeat protein